MINKKLQIKGKKIMLCGNRSYQNMGDELILIGLVKLLISMDKKVVISCYDTEWMKKYISKFVSLDNINFLTELPKGFRSLIRYFKERRFKEIISYFKVDTYIIGGGEILTEETPYCRYYWLSGVFPGLLSLKKLYFMGGVQPPKKRYNKIVFKFFLNYANHFYMRDFQCVQDINSIKNGKASFFMDTSYFVLEDRKKIERTENQYKYIVVNLNSKGRKFLDEIIKDIQIYIDNGYKIKYVPVSKGKWDPDIDFYKEILKHFQRNNLDIDNIELLDWEEDFEIFLGILKGSEIVISSRLHLFLISSFIGCKTKVYPYQKKILKMQDVLEKVL